MIYSANDTAAAVRRGLAAARDRSHPDDAFRTPAKYARMSRDFRAGAWKHLLDDVDLPQASNKAWGLVAETVKAISAHHGGVIHTHRAIWTVVQELAELVRQSGDVAESQWLSNAFRTARGLHSNFYEGEESRHEVEAGITLCEQLSARLYELFAPVWAEGRQSDDFS